MKQVLSQSIVSGGNRSVFTDYALEFNGTDEFLQIALPSELVTNGNFETFPSWSSGNTISFAQDTETGKQGNYCAKWVFGIGGNLTIATASALVVGQKYKVKMYYKSTTDIVFQSSTTTVYTLKATSEWNYISFIFTAVGTTVRFYSATVAGTAFLDNVSMVFDQGFDLNKDQEQILHSKNCDFERTLGAEIATGTVTIGKKYIVTAGTVEGNAVGTEFLAVTATTTLDASNKVKPIPNLVTNGTCEGTYVNGRAPNWTGTGNEGTSSEQTGVSGKAQGFTYTSDIFSWNIRANLNLSYLSGKRYRITFNYTRVSGTSTEFSIRFGTTVYSVTGADGTWKTYTVDSTASLSLDYIAFGMKAGHTDAVWAVDNIHIYEIPEWTASGNHTGDISTLDKSSGTQSLKVTASGAGSSGSNYVSLPAAQIDTLVSGNKYTLEGFARSDTASRTITVKIGTKEVTSATLSTTAGTFTKFVLNFEWQPADVTAGQDLKLWLSGAGSVYVDKLSLTQAYDVVRCYKFKVTNAEISGDSTIIMYGGVGAVDAGGMMSYYNLATNNLTLNAQSYDYKASDSLSSGVISRNILTNAIDYWDRTTALRLYINGVLKASGGGTNFGKVLNTHSTYCFRIGHWTTAGTPKFAGQISHIQIIRFENISQSTFNSALTGLQFPTGGGAEEVLRVTFQNGSSITECLKDYSPKGHTVSGILVDITNRKRVTS